MLVDIIEKAKNILMGLTSAQVTLISVFVTLFLFFMGKRKENKLKVYEIRKEKYEHLLHLLKNLFSKSNNSEELMNVLNKERFFDVGSSLAIYASKKLYKKYCLYRELSINENLKKFRFYDNYLIIYLIGDMYKLMRKEIGLNTDIFKIQTPDLLFFFLNDINKPEYRKKYYEYKYKMLLIRLLIISSRIDSGVYVSKIFNGVIKPLFLIVYIPIHLIIRIFIVKPLKYIYRKITNIFSNKTTAP